MTKKLACLHFFLGILVYSVIGSVSAYAFSLPFLGRGPVPKRGHVTVSETSNYVVLFYRTGAVRFERDPKGKEIKSCEIGYKVSDRTEPPERLLGDRGWGEVLFLDDQGFVVARDTVQEKEFIVGHEFYGFIWVNEDKAEQIRRADLRILKESEMGDQTLQRIRKKHRFKASSIERLPVPPASPAPTNTLITHDEIQKTIEDFEQKKPTVI